MLITIGDRVERKTGARLGYVVTELHTTDDGYRIAILQRIRRDGVRLPNKRVATIRDDETMALYQKSE